jgi:hypothetical protein
LTWTISVPCDFGFYWWRRADSAQPEIVKVAGTHAGVRVYFHNSIQCKSPAELGGTWSGPIERGPDA